MKNWMLDFNINPSKENINYHQKMLFIGSCFSESIAIKMQEALFQVLQNPHGILFDPLSISRAISSYIANKQIDKDALANNAGIFHSWDHHSSFSHTNPETVWSNINASTINAHNFLKQADWLIITMATSFYYELKSGTPVANCHKAPSSTFNKKLIPSNDITQLFLNLEIELRKFNPSLKIIYTISPVRHIRDGIIENNISKARLIEAIHSLTNNKDHNYYFPSYEIAIDILRDYRFFNADGVHPTNEAINYIFERFLETYLLPADKKIYSEIMNWHNQKMHTPLHPQSTAYKKFREQLDTLTDSLIKKYPFINFTS